MSPRIYLASMLPCSAVAMNRQSASSLSAESKDELALRMDARKFEQDRHRFAVQREVGGQSLLSVLLDARNVEGVNTLTAK